MKPTVALAFTALAFLANPAAACDHAPRIDGTSDAAFDRSYAALIESLSAEDQMRLHLAELILLTPKGCLATKPIPDQPFLTQSLGGQVDIRPCREELHGMTFNDIMNLAYPEGEPSDGGALAPPNHSFKPMPLRGTA